MILEHAPFGRRGFFANFTQGRARRPSTGGRGVSVAGRLHAKRPSGSRGRADRDWPER